MFLQEWEIMDAVIKKSQILATKQKQSYRIFQINEQNNLYFRLIQFPDFLSSDIEQTKSIIDNIIKRYHQQYQLSKKKISPYLLKYQGVHVCYPNACFIHEPITDNLANWVKDKSLSSFGQKINVMIQITKAFQQLHQNKICVRSLRPFDILICHKQGFAKPTIAFSNISQYTTLCQQNKIVQKPINDKNEYVAPEIRKKQSYNLLCDTWTLGTIFYETLFAVKFKDLEEFQLNISKIQAPVWISKLLKKMICINPRDRYVTKDILVILRKAQICSKTCSRFENLQI